MKSIIESNSAVLDRYFISSVSYEEYLYWISERNGFLYRMDTKTNHIELTDVKWGLASEVPFANGVLLIDDNMLYVLLDFGRRLLKYNIANGVYEIITVFGNPFPGYDFSFAKKIGEYIYYLEYNFDFLRRIDTNSGKVEQIFIHEYKGMKQDFYYPYIHNQIDDDMYIFVFSENLYYKYDACKEKKQRYYYPVEIKEPLYVQVTEEGFYILTASGEVFLWNGSSRNVIEIFSNNISKHILKYEYGLLYKIKNKLWLLPAEGENIICIDLNTKKYDVFKDYPDDFYYTTEFPASKYGYGTLVNGVIYFAMRKGNYIFSVNENGEGKFIDARWPKDCEKQIYIAKNMGECIHETEGLMEVFLRRI